MKRKYTKEVMLDAIDGCKSMACVLRNLGLIQSGGNHSHIKKTIQKLGINISHFTGQACNKGKTDPKRLSAKEILVYDRHNGRREEAFFLRRSLLEEGVNHECGKCFSKPIWNGEKLVLQVHHKNGKCLDNRKRNLIFLCPNCHSQM